MPISRAHVSACYFFEKIKTLTGGARLRQHHVNATLTHVSATRMPRGLHAAPRRVHLSAAGRGAPAVAGGDSGHPSKRGRARWKAESKGNQMEAAPLGFGRRRNGGEHFRGGRSTTRTDSTNPCRNASTEGTGRKLSSP